VKWGLNIKPALAGLLSWGLSRFDLKLFDVSTLKRANEFDPRRDPALQAPV
jgi:hypothetical protein